MRLLDDRIMVRLDESNKSAGGIELPSSVQKAQRTGTVLAIGEGAPFFSEGLCKWTIRPMRVAIGDRVQFSEHAGLMIEYGPKREKVLMAHEGDIVVILDK